MVNALVRYYQDEQLKIRHYIPWRRGLVYTVANPNLHWLDLRMLLVLECCRGLTEDEILDYCQTSFTGLDEQPRSEISECLKRLSDLKLIVREEVNTDEEG